MKETNQPIKAKEETPITDVKELNEIQNELVKKSNGKFIKKEKPKGVKLIKKELTQNMVISLIFAYKHYKYSVCNMTDYFPKKTLLQYIKEFPNITRRFNQLKYWDLIHQMPISPDEVIYKKGWYGITENGIAFIQKEIAMPKYALVHDDFAYEHIVDKNHVMITDFFDDEALEELLKP
jgi:hypothetical protein